MLACFPKPGTITLAVLALGIGGFPFSAKAEIYDGGELEIKLALAQEEIDRLCAFTDMTDKIDRTSDIPSTDRDYRISFHKASLMCRDAKHAYIAILDRQEKQRKALERAERSTPQGALRHSLKQVKRYCVFPQLEGPLKEFYTPLLNDLLSHSEYELTNKCREAKKAALALMDAGYSIDEASPGGYGKEYRPPKRPNFSDGPLDLE